MQSAQVVTLKSGQQNASSVDSKSAGGQAFQVTGADGFDFKGAALSPQARVRV